MSHVPLKCSCGAVRGVLRDVSPSTVNHIVCYCDDCQTYARWLGGAGILDPHGGTEIAQLSPARLEITEGREHLACVRLSPKGMVRWYASCCRTPIGNTLASPSPPFVGVVHSFVDAPAGARDAAFGPIRARVQGRFATGDRSTLDAHDRAPVGLILRTVVLMLRWWLRGDADRSPLIDPVTGALRAEPRVLSAEERAAVG